MAKKKLFDQTLVSEISGTLRMALGLPTTEGAVNITWNDYLRLTGTPVILRGTLTNEEKSITIPSNSVVTNIDFKTVTGSGTIEAGTTSNGEEIIPETDPTFNQVSVYFPTGGNLYLKANGFTCNYCVMYKYNYF